jgi:CheY-like chemotaxis protein
MSGKKILLVDDNDAVRELLREVLEGAGYEVQEAADGHEALERVEEIRPNLVMLDLQMPKLDGFSVLRALRANPRFASLRVVALTAYAMQGDQERVLGAGFDGYVAKPVDIAALRMEVRRFL